jgi:methyl-accepting chemotaxis protein
MSYFRNIKLTKKISLLTISFFIFLGIIGFASINQISNVNSKIMELNDARMTPIIELENIKSDIEYIKSQGSSLMDATDTASKKTINGNIEAAITNVDSALKKYKNNAEFKTLLNDYENFKKAKVAFVKSVNTNRAVPQVSAGTNTQTGTSAKTGASTQAVTNKQSANVVQGPPEAVTKFDKIKNTLIEDFDKIINKQIVLAKQTYEDSKTVYKNTLVAIVSLLILCGIITLLLSIVIIRAITVPLKKVTTKLGEISQSNGDLTQRINYDSKDEIGQLSSSFDTFIGKLQTIISEVAISADTISLSSNQLNVTTGANTKALKEISNTIEAIASGTSDEAAAAEETTASLVEAAQFSEATSNASKNTTNNSKKAKDAAENGAAIITEVVSSITDIADSSKEVSIMINKLDDSSKKIGDIIKIISGISEQTNLLALNAAIEAARAGDAGKGFSVVAEEIRKLADESNKASKKISDLVKENQLKSASAVESVSQVEKKVSLGVSKASEVGESIQNIIKNIQDIVNEVEQIDYANEQQAQTTKEIEKAIGNIAITSGEIAGSTENISLSIENQLSAMTKIEETTKMLSEMANKLTKLTSGFRV